MSSTLLSRSLNDARDERRDGRKPYNRPTVTDATTTATEGRDRWSHDMFGGVERERRGGPVRRDYDRGPTDKLHIDQLHYEVSEVELEQLFGQVGKLSYKPQIHFDRSGRSLGRATVKYERVADAEQALELFDGCPAKGQNIRVTYDYRPDTKEADVLLARMSVPKERQPRLYSRPEDEYDRFRSAGGDGSRFAGRGRGRGRAGGPGPGMGDRGRGGGGGRGGRGGSRSDRGSSGRGPPKSADDLDRELEAFMAADDGKTAATSGVVQNDDVEMS